MNPYPVDYHIHYYLDSCAGPDMTCENIGKEAGKLGLKEIGIVKHCSETLPGGKDFVSWHLLREEDFQTFIREVRAFSETSSIPVYAGVESELVSEDGTIAVTGSHYEAIDHIMLSVHYMPLMECIGYQPLIHPRAQRNSIADDRSLTAEYDKWRGAASRAGAAAIIEGLVRGYMNAIRRNKKICACSHMYDGLLPIRDYDVPCDDLPESDLIAIFEPLMRLMAQEGVLWELLPEKIVHPAILRRADESGVRFIAATDAHSITGGWGNLSDHWQAEDFLAGFGLHTGRMRESISSGIRPVRML